jgi:hypothetical protein
MGSWAEFASSAPEIEAAGRRLLSASQVAFLATVSREGRPRVHPFCPAIVDGHLFGFILAGSPKRRDLDRSGQFAIHAWLGPEDEQFYVAGSAFRTGEAELRGAVVAAMPYDDADERHLLYEFRPAQAMWTVWHHFQKPEMRPQHFVWREGESAH